MGETVVRANPAPHSLNELPWGQPQGLQDMVTEVALLIPDKAELSSTTYILRY